MSLVGNLTSETFISQSGKGGVILAVGQSTAVEALCRLAKTCLVSGVVVNIADEEQAVTFLSQLAPRFVILEWTTIGRTLVDVMGKGVLHGSSAIVVTTHGLVEEEMECFPSNVVFVLCKGVLTMDEARRQMRQALTVPWQQSLEARRMARRAIGYLHGHAHEPFQRKRLARYLGVHEDYLTESFRLEAGLPPCAYLARYRMKQARCLLEEGQLTLAEIAEKVGFLEPSYFSRVFKKLMGVSPSLYRRGFPLGVRLLE